MTTCLPMRARCFKLGNRGFTVAEVMMATLVMALGISAAILTIQRGFYAIDNARNSTLASQIIQSEMERIRLLSWPDVAALPTPHEVDLTTLFASSNPTISATITKISERFTATRTTADVSGKVGEMKDITLTVTWTGIDGIAHTRNSATQYTQNGLYDYYYTLAHP